MADQGSELNALMTKMGEESGSMRQALATPPPSGVNQTPRLEDKGLDALRPHMSENGYDTMVTLVHWAITCQKLSDGEEVRWSDETYATMQAPFVGFGNPFLWDSTYESNIGRIVHAHFLNWHARGARHRRENPLHRVLLREVAPLMANQAKGWTHMQHIHDIVNDGDFLARVK